MQTHTHKSVTPYNFFGRLSRRVPEKITQRGSRKKTRRDDFFSVHSLKKELHDSQHTLSTVVNAPAILPALMQGFAAARPSTCPMVAASHVRHHAIESPHPTPVPRPPARVPELLTLLREPDSFAGWTVVASATAVP